MLFVLEILREAFQVGRPAMGIVTSFLYLYNNKEPSLWMALYFGYIFQLGCNAGNDYMDWERDQAEKDREFSISRGKAKSKNAVWWHYVFATLVSFIIGCFDPLFGAKYFVITEISGQFAYNGLFLGIQVHELSIVKRVGFPLDAVVAAWTYMPFSYLVGQKSWVPDLNIAALGTTMLWAQLKDYHHEKDTSVNTTATVLGPTLTAIVISLAAIVMVHKDPRFLPYGAYTLYRCYIYPDKGVGKMTAVMALNLVGIVCFDADIAPNVKYTVFCLHLLAYLAYKYSFAMEQKYYCLSGIVNRHRPYDASVWSETNPNILLWKVGSLIGRSGSAPMGLFGTEYARLCLMGYVISRTQDTWADVCMDSEDRVKGLQLLPKRLARLMEKDKDMVGVPDSHKKDLRWDFSSRTRNRMYVDITLNVHRFDVVFLALPKAHKEILVKYANDLSEGFIELENLKDEPVAPEIMRKHAEVAIDAGFFGMCKGAAPELIAAIDPSSKFVDPNSSAAYVVFSDGVWFMNLAATIEEDVAEGVTLDEELRAMNGNLNVDVVKRVRIKWMIKSLSCFVHSRYFLFHPKLVQSWCLRFFILQFLQVSVGSAEKYLRAYQGETFKKSVEKQFFRTFVESLYEESYFKATDTSLKRAENFVGELRILQRKAAK
mmetsp:Transcript_16332/g.24054  ORF Transcript_16332/g.24054 Transcript_16332/m.24054 type:complete len:657 (+) Transcript_16332:101-2071(+)